MPTTKTSNKPAAKVAVAEAPVDAPPDDETETEDDETTETPGKKTRAPRTVRVQYAFADGGDLEVADEVPEQQELPRNTAGLVGRTSQYVKYLQRCKDEYPGKAVKIATFENTGACRVAVEELSGEKADGTKLEKSRELPEGTDASDWTFEARRVIVKDTVTGADKRVSQLWVKYLGD